MQIFGKLLIAIALIVVPFSMSHASMGLQSHDMHQNHAMMHGDHIAMDHDDQHRPNKDRDNQSNNSHHDDHETANCCSSICGGALTVDFENPHCELVSDIKLTFSVKSLEPGERVLPFRPPST